MVASPTAQVEKFERSQPKQLTTLSTCAILPLIKKLWITSQFHLQPPAPGLECRGGRWEVFVSRKASKEAHLIAILKHISVHNSNYSAAVLYFMYQHDNHARPIYDEAGLMIERENLLIDGINTTPYEYSYDCKDISRKYGKNRTKDEVKSHHWIISFDPKDVTERALTVEKAHQLGMEFAAKHFGGFPCIVATHQDGNNGSGNIHCHIAHCSVRCKDVPQPPYSNLERDSKAGFKLHVTKQCLHYLKEQTMLLCLQNGLTQIELNKPGQKNITDREYWAGKRGQERQEKVAESLSSEALPKPTIFQTELEKLRTAVESARDLSTSVEQFQTIMREKYHVAVTPGASWARRTRKKPSKRLLLPISSVKVNGKRRRNNRSLSKSLSSARCPRKRKCTPPLRRISKKHPSRGSIYSPRKSTTSRSRMKISSSTGASLTSTAHKYRRVTVSCNGRRYKTSRKTPAGLPTSPKMAC